MYYSHTPKLLYGTVWSLRTLLDPTSHFREKVAKSDGFTTVLMLQAHNS